MGEGWFPAGKENQWWERAVWSGEEESAGSFDLGLSRLCIVWFPPLFSVLCAPQPVDGGVDDGWLRPVLEVLGPSGLPGCEPRCGPGTPLRGACTERRDAAELQAPSLSRWGQPSASSHGPWGWVSVSSVSGLWDA